MKKILLLAILTIVSCSQSKEDVIVTPQCNCKSYIVERTVKIATNTPTSDWGNPSQLVSDLTKYTCNDDGKVLDFTSYQSSATERTEKKTIVICK